MNFNIGYAKKRLHIGSRAYLRPLVMVRGNFGYAEEQFFSSPQPVKTGLEVSGKEKKGENASWKEKKTGREANLSRLYKERSNTPIYIKRIEKFWEKVGKIKEFDLLPIPISGYGQKFKGSNSAKAMKGRELGFPARYQKMGLEKSKSGKDFLCRKMIAKDLLIIKVNDGADITERVKLAKFVKMQEEGSRDGILKKKNIEDSWRWYTPKGTPVNKEVRFDFNI